MNVLALGGLSFAEIAEAGAQRVSVGGGLTWVAVNAFAEAARAIRDDGDFSSLRSEPASPRLVRSGDSGAAPARPARAARGGPGARPARGRSRRERGRGHRGGRRTCRRAARGASSPGARPRGVASRSGAASGSSQREDRESLAAVEPRDGTRREAAEPSGRVVEQHGPAKLAHRVSSIPSSAASTSAPTVSST